jgi:leucyl aminopeptidase
VRRPEAWSARPAVVPAVTLGKGLDAEWSDADAVAIGVPASATRPVRPDDAGPTAAQRYRIDLDRVIAAERVSGRGGDVTRVPVASPDGLPARLLLVGTGDGTPADLRRAGAALARAVRGRRLVLTSLGHRRAPEAVRGLVEGLLLGGYAQATIGTRKRDDAAPAREFALLGRVPAAAVRLGVVHAEATGTARALAGTPSNVKNPPWLADRAVELAAEAGLTATVWDENDLARDGFGGLLAVGAGSATPPRLVRVDHRPEPTGRAARGRPLVLIGKGITYDTGGLSIKPREAMVPMKTDMAAAAAVLAAVLACPLLGVRRPVTALLPLAENAVGGGSYRPSDVIRQFGGRTVEVINTDAEGRLVLADALAYADAELDPDVVVDLATLTGAASLALGRRRAALFTADDRLAAGLTAAGRDAAEALWRLPLVEDYRPALDSQVADLRHVAAGGKVGAGAVIAALFLREFAGRRRWAHLDVAGPARSDKDEYEVSRGATGFGARLLLRWLESLR